MESSFLFDHVVLSSDEQVGRHSQRTWELDLIVKGRGKRKIGTSDYQPFDEGEVVLLRPDVEHEWIFEPSTEIENITVIFSDNWLTKIAATFPEMRTVIETLMTLPPAVLLSGQLRKRIAESLKNMTTQSAPQRLPSLLEILVIISQSSDFKTITTQNNESLAQQRIKKMDIFVRCNYARNITLDDIARHVGINRSSLCSLCKRLTGQTVVEHLTAVRIAQAKQFLLVSDDSVKKICYAVGFNDFPHFCRVFKRVVGVSPGEFRKSY